MRYATASENDLIAWGTEEMELRQSDSETRDIRDCENRKVLRAKSIGATISQANMLVRDAQAFLQRKGVRA